MSTSQYTVKLSDTAAAVYCELFSQADVGVEQAIATLDALDRALDDLPISGLDKKFQLAGQLGRFYRQKTIGYSFTYRPDYDDRSILVIEVSPIMNDDGRSAQELLERIVTDPQCQAARAALGIPEKEGIGASAIRQPLIQ